MKYKVLHPVITIIKKPVIKRRYKRPSVVLKTAISRRSYMVFMDGLTWQQAKEERTKNRTLIIVPEVERGN